MSTSTNRDNSHSPEADTYSETKTAARADAVLKRMLATPPKPHKALGAVSKRRPKPKLEERQ
ncbi:MAG TPA: hypothetical protein VH331_17680 [Allosphingosinicella sp.]|jgi:hypothetical protein|nr:hypothetical protein [Allosphingosinicella sp.]